MAYKFPQNISWIMELLNLVQGSLIKVPVDYRQRVLSVKNLMDNDETGTISTLLDFAISSASDIDLSIETDNSNLSELLNNWLYAVNDELLGKIPIGVQALAKEYYRERWKGSSFLLLRTVWGEVDGFRLPLKMWFVDGENVVVDSNGTATIGDEKIELMVDENETQKNIPLPVNSNEKIFIQKPYTSWGVDYPTPYIIQRGLYKNALFLKALADKGEIVIAKALEYLMVVKKGTESLAKENRSEFIYSDEDLQAVKKSLGTLVNDRTSVAGVPSYITNFDTDIEHLIPEYERILKPSLYTPVERRILFGLGMVDIVDSAGASIPKDEFVTVKINGQIEQKEIQEIESSITEKTKIEVPTYENGFMKWKPAELWSHHYSGNIFEIITDDSRMRVKTTGNHSIMVWSKGEGLVSKRADELSKGDMILLLDNFNVNNKKYLNVKYNNYLGSNQYKKVKATVNVKVDEDFGYFIGWLVAEGWASGGGIELSVGIHKEEAQKILNLGEKILQTKGRLLERGVSLVHKKPLYGCIFRKKGLGELFSELCKKGAKNKVVPSIIFNSPISVQKAFLRGLLEGDGHCYRERPKTALLSEDFKKWELTTASKSLAYGVLTLLKMVGETASLKIHSRKYKFKKENSDGFHEGRGTYYIIYVKTEKGVCPSSLFPGVKTNWKGYIKNLEEIQNFIDILPKDWHIERIGEINKYNYEDIVYDFEVKDNPTFVAGANILVHNSRREGVLNPKPYIGELNSGVNDFKQLIRDILLTIIKENKNKHPKFLVDPRAVTVRSTPVKAFMNDDYKTILRSLYDRGALSKRTFCEVVGDVDYIQEKQRRMKEIENGDELLMFPPVIQNLETVRSSEEDERLGKEPIDKKEEERENNKPENEDEDIDDDKVGPEARNYNNSEVFEQAPYDKITDLPDNVKNVMSKSLQKVWMDIFNKSYPEGEDYARKVAWEVIKRIAQKNKNGQWVRKKSKGSLEDIEENNE
jgi:intein/homing endonuclease/cation transport regulator ChaB